MKDNHNGAYLSNTQATRLGAWTYNFNFSFFLFGKANQPKFSLASNSVQKEKQICRGGKTD
jgi:hypothetical protein